VPTADGRNHELQPKELNGANKQTTCVDVIKDSKMEDTSSVANSPISRKRSASGSAFDIPSCSSSVEVHSQNHHPGGPFVGSSRYILQKVERSCAGKVSLVIILGRQFCRRSYEFSIFLGIILVKETHHDNTFVP
jgi:cryptochrome 2